MYSKPHCQHLYSQWTNPYAWRILFVGVLPMMKCPSWCLYWDSIHLSGSVTNAIFIILSPWRIRVYVLISLIVPHSTLSYRCLSDFLPYTPVCMRAKSLQPCPPLCDPMDCSPSGFTIHRILQTKILEWVAMPSPRGSYWSRDGTCFS